MKRAMTSFPVPDSPLTRTVVSVAVTRAAFLSASRQSADCPTMRARPAIDLDADTPHPSVEAGAAELFAAGVAPASRQSFIRRSSRTESAFILCITAASPARSHP